MAWTTPGTATAGEVLTAAFWNTNVRDNSLALRDGTGLVPASASVRRTTDQTGYTTGAAITWQSTQYDTDTMWSAGAPTRLTVNTAGIYLITFYVYVTAIATLTSIQPDILIDGNQFQTNYFPAIGPTSGYAGVSATASLTAGQYIGGAVYFSSGSAYVIKGSAGYGGSQTRLTATLLGVTA